VKGGELARTVSLPSAVFFIIGYVVGATIFILPGSLAADAGPAVFVAYALAGVPAIFAGFVMAQIGSALPVSGANYVLIREVLSPYLGFLYQWIMVSMAAVAIPLIAFGFADYLGYFLPGMDDRVVAATLTILFVILNAFGMTVVATVQNLMVIVFLIALVVFGIGGVSAGDASLLRPLFPRGYPALTIAAITASFSYAGVYVIAEIAGEVKRPGRNIPLAILLGFVIIILLYVLVPLALSMLIPWQELAETPMAVVTAAQIFLPTPVVTFVAIAALFAAATSVNGIIMGLSRDFLQGATGGFFPQVFTRVNARSHAPVHAVILVGMLALGGILVGGAIVSYVQVALIGMMIIQIMTGIALLKLPGHLPEAYDQAKFKLGGVGLKVVCYSYIAFSAIMLVLLVTEKLQLMIIGVGFLLAGVIYYLLWTRLAGLRPGTADLQG
jgi:APA family basic amino acid/polyamine antiporter